MSTTQQSFSFTRPAAQPVRRNIVIEAGAGTGKTTAIVAEVLRLLLDDPALNPERIVLVTFTEKAAGEIADRIHQALTELDERFADDGDVVWPIGSAAPLLRVPAERRGAWAEACAQQLARVEGLRSQTIHSFCQSLLRQFPIEAGLDPQFKIIEGFERSLLYGQLYDAWLDEETRLKPEPQYLVEWEFLLGHVGYLFLIRDIVFSLVERRDLLFEDDYDFGAIAELERDLVPALDAVRGFDAGRICRYVQETPAPRSATADEWIAWFAPIANEIRTSDLPKGRKYEDLAKAMKVLRGDAKKGSSIYDFLVSHRAAEALLALARRFVEFLDREKRKLAVVDFDDLLLRTLAVLGDDSVLERVRAQFDYLFVDEFQDTDRTQARIIDKLARDRSGAFVPGRTVLVGDPKQSIYGFRRADPETYYQLTSDMIEAGAEHRRIAVQYRSDPPLLDAVNAMFEYLFPDEEHDPNVFRPSYRALLAGKTSSLRAADARITFLQADCEERSERHDAEAASIAEWILRNRDGGERDLQRFAILFRRLTKLDDYLDAFDRYGIDYVLPPTRLFLDRRAPVDLLAVLRAVAFPFDRGAEISAARTTYFALTDEEIVSGLAAPHVIPSVSEGPGRAGRAAAGDLDIPPAPQVPRDARDDNYARFTRALDRYRLAAHHLAVSQLIDLIVETTRIEDVYAASADGDRSLRHLEHVRSIAFEYDRKMGGSVRQFVDEIARRRTEPDEMEPSLIDEGRNAVRILTVHAAKGLEFETVILPDLEFPIKPPELFTVEEPKSRVMRGQVESLSAYFRKTADGAPLKEIGKLREEAENRRLFYVAVTRAQSEVVFVRHAAQSRREGFLKCVSELFGDVDRYWPAEPGRVIVPIAISGSVIDVAFEKCQRAETRTRTRRRLITPALEAEIASLPLADPAIEEPSVTPSLDAGEIATARAAMRNRAAGILLHRVLERWDGRAPVEPLLQALAAEAGAANDAVARVRHRLATIAQSSTFRRIVAAETIGRELPLHIIGDEGQAIELRIDRLIREGDVDTVIDYKSGAPSEERLARDRQQVARYCRAVAAISGRKCEGLLWYVDEERDVAVVV